MENNKNKKSVKFQGDILNFCDFIQIFVFTPNHHLNDYLSIYTVKILKIGTPEIITIIVLQMEQLDFTVQYCVQKCRQNNKQRRP